MQVYLDNSATTQISEKARDKMIKVLYTDYGNPSSKHCMGMKAEQYIKEASKIISNAIKVEPKELIFISGGTEANNLAIIGTAMGNSRKGRHIITTNIEHPSVNEPINYLQNNGYEVSYVPVDQSGKIIKDRLYELIREDTLMVSFMYVNNEIGTVQDVEEIIKGIRSIKSDIIIHVDGVQAFGKYRIYPRRIGIDLLTFSGHKINGPKGSGVLYINDRINIKPIILGGGHQGGIRSGTENVPAIAGIGQAVAHLYTDFDKKMDRMYSLKQFFLKEISKFEGVYINGLYNGCEDALCMKYIKETAPHIMSVSFNGVKSEVFLHALEEKGIYVSSGSACSSHHSKQSETLTAIGLSEELMESTLRFSMSHKTTQEEINYTLECIKEILPKLRKYTRR